MNGIKFSQKFPFLKFIYLFNVESLSSSSWFSVSFWLNETGSASLAVSPDVYSCLIFFFFNLSLSVGWSLENPSSIHAYFEIFKTHFVGNEREAT